MQQNFEVLCLDKILVVLGVLFDKQGIEFPKNGFQGGPLGELVQWSDLLVSLHVLGHEFTIYVSTVDIKKFESYRGQLVDVNQ